LLPDPKAFAKSDDEEDVELEVDVQPEDDDDTAPIKARLLRSQSGKAPSTG